MLIILTVETYSRYNLFQYKLEKIYVLYSLICDEKLFNNGDKCYAVWGNELSMNIQLNSEYYESIFIHKDLRKQEVIVIYIYM